MRKILPIILACSLSSCATDNKSLSQPKNVSIIEIVENRVSTEVMGNLSITNILSKGIYTSVGEDSKGTYFLGPEKCFTNKNVVPTNSAISTFNCGLFIPISTAAPVQIFFVVGSQITNNESIKNIGYAASDAANQSKYTPTGAAGGAIAGAIINASMKAESGRFDKRSFKDESLVKGIREMVKLKAMQ